MKKNFYRVTTDGVNIPAYSLVTGEWAKIWEDATADWAQSGNEGQRVFYRVHITNDEGFLMLADADKSIVSWETGFC